MKRENCLLLKQRLTALECYGENSMRQLLSFGNDIKQVISLVESKIPDEAKGLKLSYGQLLESEGYLNTWLINPIKSTMRSMFREYKSDFISVLDDYIELGDSNHIWEDAR